MPVAPEELTTRRARGDRGEVGVVRSGGEAVRATIALCDTFGHARIVSRQDLVRSLDPPLASARRWWSDGASRMRGVGLGRRRLRARAVAQPRRVGEPRPA